MTRQRRQACQRQFYSWVNLIIILWLLFSSLRHLKSQVFNFDFEMMLYGLFMNILPGIFFQTDNFYFGAARAKTFNNPIMPFTFIYALGIK